MRIKTTTMTRKAKTIDKIVAKFTIEKLPNFEEDPKYKAINGMMQIQYTNTVTLTIPQVGGHHGHIVIIINPTLCTNLLTTAWANPPKPGVYPTVPEKSAAAHQDRLQPQDDKGRIIYKIWEPWTIESSQ